MGGRVTRTPQSRELVRAKTLRQALERGDPATFIRPATTVTPPPALFWASEEKTSTLGKRHIPEELLSVRRQYLEQLFQSSPDPFIVCDDSFHTLCVNHEFQRMFGYSASEVLGQP